MCCFFSRSELVGVRAVTLCCSRFGVPAPSLILLDAIAFVCSALCRTLLPLLDDHIRHSQNITRQKIQYGECNSVTHNTQRFMDFPLACTREHPQQYFDDTSGPAFLKGSSAKSRQLGQKLGCMLTIDHEDYSTKWV